MEMAKKGMKTGGGGGGGILTGPYDIRGMDLEMLLMEATHLADRARGEPHDCSFIAEAAAVIRASIHCGLAPVPSLRMLLASVGYPCYTNHVRAWERQVRLDIAKEASDSNHAASPHISHADSAHS